MSPKSNIKYIVRYMCVCACTSAICNGGDVIRCGEMIPIDLYYNDDGSR